MDVSTREGCGRNPETVQFNSYPVFIHRVHSFCLGFGFPTWKEFHVKLTENTIHLFPINLSSVDPKLLVPINHVTKITWFKRVDSGQRFDILTSTSERQQDHKIQLKSNSKEETKQWIKYLTDLRNKQIHGEDGTNLLSKARITKLRVSEPEFSQSLMEPPSEDQVLLSEDNEHSQNRRSPKTRQRIITSIDSLNKELDFILERSEESLEGNNNSKIESKTQTYESSAFSFGIPQAIKRRKSFDCINTKLDNIPSRIRFSTGTRERLPSVDSASMGIHGELRSISVLRKSLWKVFNSHTQNQKDSKKIATVFFMYNNDLDLLQLLIEKAKVYIDNFQAAHSKAASDAEMKLLITLLISPDEFLKCLSSIFALKDARDFFQKEEPFKDHDHFEQMFTKIQNLAVLLAWQILQIESRKRESFTTYSTVLNHVINLELEEQIKPSFLLSESFARFIDTILETTTPSMPLIHRILFVIMSILSGEQLDIFGLERNIGMISKVLYPEVWKSFFSVLKNPFCSPSFVREVIMNLNITLVQSWKNATRLLIWDSSLWCSWLLPFLNIGGVFSSNLNSNQKTNLHHQDSTITSKSVCPWNRSSGDLGSSRFFLRKDSKISDMEAMKNEISVLCTSLLSALLHQSLIRSAQFEQILRGILKSLHNFGLTTNSQSPSLLTSQKLLSSILSRLSQKQSLLLFPSNFCSLQWSNFLLFVNTAREFLFFTAKWEDSKADQIYFESASPCIYEALPSILSEEESELELEQSTKRKLGTWIKLRDGNWDFGAHVSSSGNCSDISLIENFLKVFGLMKIDQKRNDIQLRHDPNHVDVGDALLKEIEFFEKSLEFFKLLDKKLALMHTGDLYPLVERFISSACNLKSLSKTLEGIIATIEMLTTTKEASQPSSGQKSKPVRASLNLEAIKNVLMNSLEEGARLPDGQICFTGKDVVQVLTRKKIASSLEQAIMIGNLLASQNSILQVSSTSGYGFKNDTSVTYCFSTRRK